MPGICTSSPCMNGGTCDDSCIEGSGYKCICIGGRMGDRCQNWTSKWEKAFQMGLLIQVNLIRRFPFLNLIQPWLSCSSWACGVGGAREGGGEGGGRGVNALCEGSTSRKSKNPKFRISRSMKYFLHLLVKNILEESIFKGPRISLIKKNPAF